MYAWHFCKIDESGRPVLRDGRPLVIGEKLVHHGKPVLCESGYHASERALDALQYAPGDYACWVRLGGEIVRDDDKLVATERTALWGFDASDLLRLFARERALSVIDKWDAPAVVREYLETGEESLRDAAWAAGAAAWAADWAADWAAAWDSANAHLESLLWSAAMDMGLVGEEGE